MKIACSSHFSWPSVLIRTFFSFILELSTVSLSNKLWFCFLGFFALVKLITFRSLLTLFSILNNKSKYYDKDNLDSSYLLLSNSFIHSLKNIHLIVYVSCTHPGPWDKYTWYLSRSKNIWPVWPKESECEGYIVKEKVRIVIVIYRAIDRTL